MAATVAAAISRFAPSRVLQPAALPMRGTPFQRNST
jgi:hypothetical protein